MCIFYLINLDPVLYDFLSSIVFGSIRCSFSNFSRWILGSSIFSVVFNVY